MRKPRFRINNEGWFWLLWAKQFPVMWVGPYRSFDEAREAAGWGAVSIVPMELKHTA
jgi:hypothetical protein